jgi:hypothetical protein
MRYLLGDLPEADRQRVERECLADDELAEALTEVENDLIDSYACGELSDKQRLQFEKSFLDSDERHEHIEVARLLMDPAVRERVATSAVQSRRQSWWQSFVSSLQHGNFTLKVAAAGAGMAMAALAVFLVLQNQHLRTEVSKLQSAQTNLHQQIAELQQAAQTRTAGEKDADDGPRVEEPPPLVIVSALLKPELATRGGGRGSGNPPLTIPATAWSVTILLDLQSDQYSRYSVVLVTAEGKIVRRIQGLRSQPARGGRVIPVHLPPEALPRGDYVLTLSGTGPNSTSQDVDSYSFSVSR